jgi:polysaccharide pyruvyl transferase WcaK-like protein
MDIIDIIIIGYYNHYNLGDDQYMLSFINLFKFIKYNSIKFVDCDKIFNTEIKDTDIIILGGGDVLNNYFINNINIKFENKPNKLFAVSVGLPYTYILTDTGKLNIFDHIFIRSKQDISLFSKYYKNISYIPDISYNLSCDKYNVNNTFCELHAIKATKKIIGFALSRHIYHNQYIQEYNNCILNLYHFIKNLIILDYHIIFIPFNTNSISTIENDILIYNDIITLFSMNDTEQFINNNITFIKNKIEINQLFELYDIIDYCIPMRYHACLFSIYTNTPFLPIYTTRKISNLLLDINWQHSYKLECNTIDIPITINYNELLTKFDNLVNANIDTIYDFKNEYNIAIDNFNNIFLEKLAYQKLDDSHKPKIIEQLDNITENNRIVITYKAVENFCNKYNYSDFRLIKDIKLQDTIIKIVSYYLTNGIINSKYNYGLAEKMFNSDYNYKEEWEWIMNDCKNTTMPNNPDGLINLNYIDQNDHSGAHRSGWQYVFENIKHLHNYNGIIMDMSIDKTFHWNADINKILNIIPYKKPWIGFVHHTFDTTFSDYNCNTLLKSEEFKESLNCCKGIIVLSDDLKNKFIANGINNVYSIIHPTTVDVIKFKFNNFITNPDKKIIYIGGWLRNTYNFYNITIPPMKYNHYCYKNTYTIDKVALKGKNMHNYYPKNDFMQKLHNILINNTEEHIIEQNCSFDKSISNNWYKHLYNDIEQKINNIKIINYIDNDEYDTLLSQNIVYINLVDASAINTLIECIVRNTPILINKIPSVVELLGNDYPLYYENDIDVYHILSDATNIKKAYYYIKNIPKTDFYIETFVDNLIKIIKKIYLTHKMLN